MKRLIILLCCALVISGTVLHTAQAQEKRAQAGMKFLAVTSDARAAALGEAFTAVEGTSQSLFFNPAGIARGTGLAMFAFGQTNWIADIKHNFGSAAFSPFGGEYGVLGVFVQSVDYGLIEQTIRSSNRAGYEELEPFRPKALCIGGAYARALSEKFSIGAAVKYVTQNLGSVQLGLDGTRSSNKANSMAFDFGVLYKTGFKSLAFGMTVRNFSRDLRYVNENFQMPLTFKIGVAMDVMDVVVEEEGMHDLLLTFDAEHPRDYEEQLKAGAEYTFMKMLALRVGYVGPADEHSISYGVGVQHDFGGFGIGVDYAYTPFGIFSNVQRFDVRLSF